MKHRAPKNGAKKLRSNGGFTLVELVVTMLIMGILSLTLANFIADWLQTSTLAQARANLLADAENALDTVNTDIRLSGAADANNRWPDANAPGGQFGWQSDGSTLVLAKAALDKNNNIIFSDPSKYITQKDNEIYFVNGSTLYRRTLASTDSNDAAITTCPTAEASSSCPADKVVATGVSNFAVQYYDANNDVIAPSNANSIQLSITMQSTEDGHTIKASYNTRMVFRND